MTSLFNKALKLIKKDFRGTLFLALRMMSINLNRNLSTKTTYFICFLKNVKIGKNNQFYGTPLFERMPLSDIILGDNCRIRSDITTNLSISKKSIFKTFNKGAHIEIKDNSGINGSVITCAEKIIIGKNVLIGYNCYISDTDNHVIDPILRHTGKAETAPIDIGDNVWLGANVVVLKGVSIGANSVIGANSLVLSSIPSNVIAIGNPCRVIKKI